MKRATGHHTARGYICFSAQDWWYFSHAHSDFQLMLRLAAQEPVLFVNSIAMRMPLPGRSSQFLGRIGRKAKSMAKLVRRPVSGLPQFHVMTPVLIPFYGLPLARWLNARLVAAQVRLVARAVGLRHPACVVTIPTAAEMLPHFDHGPVVYNRSDRHSAYEEADTAYIAELEERLFREADLVVYTSSALQEEEAPLTGERARFLDHGVDVGHFAPFPAGGPPECVGDIRGPVIGYFGGFDDYLVDFELLEEVAVGIPDATLLLVGPATCSMRRFERYPNVRWVGAQPYADIPRFGAMFDVALMPWLDNTWIRYANPIKMKEYLALGLAVVTTPFPEAGRYAGQMRIVHRQRFVETVRQTLADGGVGTPASRRGAVVDMTWDAITDRLAGWMKVSSDDRHVGATEEPV